MAWVASAVAVPSASETISLYLELKEGEKADFEVVGRAAAAFAEVVKEIAYILEPGLEVKLEFESGTTGSLSLNAILKAVKTRKGIKASLIGIILGVATAFIQRLPGDIRTFGVGKLIEWYVLPQDRRELSDAEIERIAKAVKDVLDGKTAKEQIRQVYKEIERDTAIESVGTITQPNSKPPAPVPRDEFPARAGIVPAIETPPTNRKKYTIERLTLISPVLVEADRVWRFASPLGELGYMACTRFGL